MFLVSRIEYYKHSDCDAVYAECNRTLVKYDNPDWKPEKSKENVYLVSPDFDGRLSDYILSKKSEYKCRLNVDKTLPADKQTNCFCQALFSATPEFFDGKTRDDVIEYYQHCLLFFCSQYPSAEIISACIHFDESGSPHMHLNFLPLIQKVNSKGKLKTVFSTSELFKGLDHFKIYQDKFFEYMSGIYKDRDIQRKRDGQNVHYTVKEYKRAMDDLNRIFDERAAVQSEVDEAKNDLQEIQEIKNSIISNAPPSLSMKIELANAKRQLKLYERFIMQVRKLFPQIDSLISHFGIKFKDLER